MNSRFARSGNLRRDRFIAVGLSIAVVAGSMLLFTRGSVAELKGPKAVDRHVTQAITSILGRDHLTRHALNDEISERWLKSYLKMLDLQKVYFLQSDVDEFSLRKNDLDDMARAKDLSFGYQVFDRFLQRVEEKVKIIDELLAMDHDFTVEEDLITDPDKLSYARNEAEVRENWRKRIKYDLLTLKVDKEKVEGKEAREKLTRRYHSFVKRMRQTDNDELLEMYLTAFTTSYDPHTTYMSPGSLENFNIQMRLKLQGIGAALQFSDGYTVVSTVIPGGAADKDGRLKPKDRVVGVGQGENGEIEDVVDMKLNDVVKKIRGDKGTVVRLQVLPFGKTDREIYNITRAEIELKDSEARSKIIDGGQRPDGKAFRIGVIDLPSFYMDMEGARKGDFNYKSTTRDVEVLLKKFSAEGVDAVLLDLRRNGGGSLTEAINLTGLFIETGPVVQVKDAGGAVTHYEDIDKKVAWTGPLVVLTSKFSASASEIFAGAIQDYQRGLVVGDHSTHGKGTVQSLLNIAEQVLRIPNATSMGALKITMQQFYRPNGDSTQNRGVLADVELPSLSNQLDIGEGSLDYALNFDHVNQCEYRKLGQTNGQIVQELNKRSADRIKDSKDFAKVLKNIARYNEYKERKRTSLNEEKFLADRAELNADREEENELEELNNPNRDFFDPENFYNKETVAVASDYLRLLQSPQGAIGQR